MSDYHLGGGLRTVASAARLGQPGRRLPHWLAKRDGRHVLTLRCVETEGGFDVECDVYPVDSPGSTAQRKGPYAFDTEAEARQFADDAALALQYLGCDVVESAAA